MVIEVTLVIIAVSLVLMVGGVIAMAVKVNKTIDYLQADLHRVSFELTDLMFKVNQLTTDLQAKSESLNFIFEALRSHNANESSEEGDYPEGAHAFDGGSTPHNKTMPQVIGWLLSSVFLIKKTKEFIKKIC